ncbi:MAG TPA: 2Fe-2S iron-sulfur cluster-binding protein [Blastocatellia bacterium]|jgi:2Fe-2S ferredoxin|nr:2Fe-2S iron-sulfur cluster-binding protein [Blastocatellia bacterium]
MEAGNTGSAVADRETGETEKKAHKVTFILQNGETKTVEYEPGVTPYHEHGLEGSLLDIALNFGIPLEHACGGNCACTTCHVIVKQGEENLSEMDECEEDRLYLADGLTLHSRLGCQAIVKGDVTVEVAD